MTEDAKRPKWRFSIKAALAAMLAVCVGLALFRFAVLTNVLMVAAAVTSFALLAFAILCFLDRDLPGGLLWGVLSILVLALGSAILITEVPY